MLKVISDYMQLIHLYLYTYVKFIIFFLTPGRSKCLSILAALLLVVTVYNWASKISDNDSNGRVQFKESAKIIHRLFDEAIASITDAQMLVLLNTGYISHSQRRVYGANDSTWHQVWDMYIVGSYSTSNRKVSGKSS